VKAEHVALVYAKELRETLRDRRTIIVMVLFPLVVYPLLSILAAQVLASKEAKQEARPSRVSIGGPDADTADIRRAIESTPHTLILVPSAAGGRAQVVAGTLDALVEVRPGVRAPDGGAGTASVDIVFDGAREESQRARDRLNDALGQARPVGCEPRFTMADQSVAPRAKMGGYVLSKILPLAVILMVVLGAFYPAIDVTAGERERGTLETILSSPIDRFDLMTGKVLAVATLATLSGVLNLASLSVTLLKGLALTGAGTALTIPWGRALATLIVIVPASFQFASLLVAVGSIARSFKEAQNLLTPVYFLCFMPAMVAALGEYPLAGLPALVPGVNVTLLARDLMLAKLHPGTAAVVLGSTLLYGGLCLALATRLYDSERLLYAADDAGSFGGWLQRLLGRGGGAAPVPASPADDAARAAALFGIGYALLYFVFLPLQKASFARGLLISQWVGLLGMVWLYARLSARRLRDVLRFHMPTARDVAGALLVGLSAWVVLAFLVEWVFPAPQEVVDRLRDMVTPRDGSRSLVINLFLIAVTPAICEEALFRGPILRGLAARFAPATAAVLTGILFGLFHMDLWRLVPTSLLGVLLSWVALASGTIVPAMIVHLMNNGVLVTVSQLGGDDRLSKLSTPAQAALFVAALGVLTAGVLLLRGSRSARNVAEPTREL